MAAGTDSPSFVAAFGEWVEACWFGEREAAVRRLDAVLEFPADVVLVGSLAMLARLLEWLGGPDDEVAAAVAQHLVVDGPDPGREALIGEVVRAVRSPAPAARSALVARHGVEAVTVAALESASFLAQAVADRDGVVPSRILLDL